MMSFNLTGVWISVRWTDLNQVYHFEIHIFPEQA